ncbi:hypothetical protein [Streptomyces violascens]|uniref:hypothetical protein n=1 Tax=Streptomyces violascens TaxID=67381 RepID=UPI001676D8F8|nr:hypothetical protein [Streptomyces violascens]
MPRWVDARDEVLIKVALAPTDARISARGGELDFIALDPWRPPVHPARRPLR